jgi:predicted O-methyltransferase YrrM
MTFIKTKILQIIDFILIPFTFLAALYFRFVRFKDVKRMIFSRAIFRRIGLTPVTNHYYDPFLEDIANYDPNSKTITNLDFNIDLQFQELKLLKPYIDEFNKNINYDILLLSNEFQFFQPVEAELYYSIIKHHKPKKIIEIGSGYSSKIAKIALDELNTEIKNHDMICIEPFENKWLEQSGFNVIRKIVQEVDLSVFQELDKGDILFIDSSHMIKPGGDVLFIYHKVLPILKPGVLVHIHDIFTPYDYPKKWIVENHSFWNEQYLMESFLLMNKEYKTKFSLYQLCKDYSEESRKIFSSLNKFTQTHPSSYWICK